MRLTHKPRQRLSWLPPGPVIGLLCGFFIAISLAFEILSFLTGISGDGFDLAVTPILEEAFKLWLALKFRESAFSAIVTFGVMEFILNKVPAILLIQPTSGELPLLMIFALLAIVFHVATAFAYKSAVGKALCYGIFPICVILHTFYNSISVLSERDDVFVVGATVICGAVIASSKLLAVASHKTGRT